MEYVDGEGTDASRAVIEAHLARCAACQAIAGEQHALSREMAAWHVAPAPDTLRAVAGQASRRWTRSRYVLAGLSTAAAISIFVTYQAQVAPPRLEKKAEAPAAPRPTAGGRAAVEAAPMLLPKRPGGGGGGRPDAAFAPSPSQLAATIDSVAPATQPGRALIRTATLQIVATDFSHVRTAVERIVADMNGFADQLSVSADPGSARVLRGSLRVPGDRLDDALARLRALGQVTHDQQNAQDVADQLVDLDARLKNARATEQRLTELLRERTGKLSDVLEVEQELSRVRLDIERLDAEKTNTSRRVAYAAIDVTIGEERKAGVDPGPLSLGTQIRVAAADGLQTVVDTLVGLVLFALRAGPALAVWAIAAAVVWTAVKRARRARSV